MQHIVFHNVDLQVNPLEIFNGIITTLCYRHNMVKARILADNQLLPRIGTSIILPLEQLLNG